MQAAFTLHQLTPTAAAPGSPTASTPFTETTSTVQPAPLSAVIELQEQLLTLRGIVSGLTAKEETTGGEGLLSIYECDSPVLGLQVCKFGPACLRSCESKHANILTKLAIICSQVVDASRRLHVSMHIARVTAHTIVCLCCDYQSDWGGGRIEACISYNLAQSYIRLPCLWCSQYLTRVDMCWRRSHVTAVFVMSTACATWHHCIAHET